MIVAPTPTLPTLDESTRAKRFDEVWQAVADHYLYADFHGIDWNAIRAEYRPRALAASDSDAFYAVLRTMVGRLDDRHSRYLSPQEATTEQRVTGGKPYVGVGTIEDSGVVLGVFQDSPAREVGLRRRDRILLVNGVEYGSKGASLSGPEGSRARLQIQSPGESPREVDVERRGVVAKLALDAYRLGHTNIGYIAIPWFWTQDVGEQARLALLELLEDGQPDGLVIDLRENSGGWRNVLEGVLAPFMEGKAGDFYSQDNSYALTVKPNDLYARLRSTPLVVLVDRGTQSYAEVCAAALQAAGRARVVGVTTAGNTETIYAHDFDDGSRLWIAQEGFKLPSGVNLEGRGVIPDSIIDVDWTSFNDADDPQVKEALKLLLK